MTISLTQKIYDLLLKRKLVTQEDLDKARDLSRETGGNLGEMLLKMDLVSRENLLIVMSEGLGYPLLNLSRVNIPEDVLKAIRVLPLRNPRRR